jgi:hypothetical protein
VVHDAERAESLVAWRGCVVTRNPGPYVRASPPARGGVLSPRAVGPVHAARPPPPFSSMPTKRRARGQRRERSERSVAWAIEYVRDPIGAQRARSRRMPTLAGPTASNGPAAAACRLTSCRHSLKNRPIFSENRRNSTDRPDPLIF